MCAKTATARDRHCDQFMTAIALICEVGNKLACGGNDPGRPYLVACACITRGARRANSEPGHYFYGSLSYVSSQQIDSVSYRHIEGEARRAAIPPLSYDQRAAEMIRRPCSLVFAVPQRDKRNRRFLTYDVIFVLI